MTESNLEITVEVAYALPDKQVLKVLNVSQGTTALEAVKQSGILQLFPEIDIALNLKPLRDFFLILFFFSLGGGFDLSLLPSIAIPAILLALVMLSP